jgi:DNA-binding response OmpR family regulator
VGFKPLEAKMSGTVLIADRIATNRIVLRSMLGKLFDNYLMADSGLSAIDCLVDHAPDVAIVSGDFTDWEVSALLVRMRLMAPGMRVLCLVPNSLPARMVAFDAGSDDVMAQPVDHSLLIARVRRLLRTAGPVQAMASGLAEPSKSFEGLVPIRLISTQAVTRSELVAQLRTQHLMARDHTQTGRATVLWGQSAEYQFAGRCIASAKSPVVCVLPGLNARRETELLDQGAADVLTEQSALPELRVRLLRVLPAAA